MTAFQVLLVGVFGSLLILTLIGLARGAASRVTLGLRAVVWTVGLVAGLRPQLTTEAAKALGIRRGADLLLYCTALVVLIGMFMLYLRLRRMRRDFTVLTRRLAHLEAELHGDRDHD